MPPAVLDTSAIARLFLEDADHVALRGWVEAALRKGAPLLAPELALYELGRTIQRAMPQLSPAEQDHLLHHTLDPFLLEAAPTAAAFDLARAHDLSFYDACFVALAQDRGAELITFDLAQARAGQAEGVRAGPPRGGDPV